jgi:hypothetical protein
MQTTAKRPTARNTALYFTAALTVPLSAIGCATPQPPRITSVGALPTGSGARFVLTEGAVDPAWLDAADITRCLESKGMLAGGPPQYLVQYAVAIRPETSTLLIGKQPVDAAPTAQPDRKRKGERIIYKLVVDRISDSARLYEVTVDAGHKARRSSAASRAAQLCAGIDKKAG